MLPWIICGVFAVIIAILAIKIRMMQKSMDEICSCLSEHLSSDTNQLITVSSSDKHVRHLASEIAKQLTELRRQRRQYISGDRELKEAVTNISHDLRTPLTAICGYLELLEAEEMTDNTAEFLEYALAELGLNRREANEFIVFWLPMMQNNEYNIISFQGIAYTDSAKLNIDPAPDTLIRVFMAWQASEIYVNIPEQELNAPAREGFTVVEWGGTKVK